MNEQIKQLADKAGLELIHNQFLTAAQQKFAQLIVRECIQAIQNEGQTYKHLDAGEFQANNFSQAVKQHFGVEE